MADARPTRGHGFLEEFLSKKRTTMALHLLKKANAGGTIVDIGCGRYPFFLTQAQSFERRIGIDRLPGITETNIDGVTLMHHDLEVSPVLHLDDHSIDAVTMLAVFEHIEPVELQTLMTEVRRILRPGGILALTTPAQWTGWILRTLAFLKFLSAEEIDEHKHEYTHAEIRDILEKAGFSHDRITCGTFELGMNLWVTAGIPL